MLRIFVIALLVVGCRKPQGGQGAAQPPIDSSGNQAGSVPQQPLADGRDRLRRFWQVYGEATQLRIAGRSDEAAERYREALRQNPAHEDSLYYLAACLSDEGNYSGAVEVLERLVRQNPASHRGHFQLGVALSTPLPGAMLDFARARREFERNVEINGEESGPFLRLGELALCQGNLVEARRNFGTAAGFQSPEGIFRSGFVRYLSGEYREALPFFRRVLDINAREKSVSGRGVRSEGDIQPGSRGLTPLEGAGIESLVYLYWASQKLGGYPADIPAESRITAPDLRAPFRFVPWNTPEGIRVPKQIPSLRDLWDKDWKPSRSGGPALEVSLPTPMHHPVVDMAEADLNGDGIKDLIALPWKSRLSVLAGAGRSYAGIGPDSGLPQESIASFSIAVLDFDRDGRPDILVAPYPPYVDVLRRLTREPTGRSPYSLRLFRNLGGWKFAEVKLPGLDTVHGVVRAIPADFDCDGFPDLLLACGGLDGLRVEPSVVLRNENGKAFRVAAYLPAFGAPVRALGAATADFDGDGRTDVCLRTPAGIRCFRNLPSP